MSTKYTNVIIAIQARSTSSRFPGKCFELIGGIPLLQHVIDACKNAEFYMNRKLMKSCVFVGVVLAIPEGDPIRKRFLNIFCVEGPEDDVLSRYMMVAERCRADYIVRVTGDCPLIPPHVITKAVGAATNNKYDYVSNVDEETRTALDGWDVEVISRRMLEWANETATEKSDREHVTTLIRRAPPEWSKNRIGNIVHVIDLSHIKLSVDTPEDLERVRTAYEHKTRKFSLSEKKHGKGNTHSF